LQTVTGYIKEILQKYYKKVGFYVLNMYKIYNKVLIAQIFAVCFCVLLMLRDCAECSGSFETVPKKYIQQETLI